MHVYLYICILTCSVSRYTPSTTPSSTTTKRLKKTTATSTLASYTNKGLSVEAYRLSDQAGRLIDKKTLTSIPPSAYISKLKRQIQQETKKSSKPLKSGGIDKIADTTNNNDNAIELYLNDDIILKTIETNIIDPYLITIPLSIAKTNPLLKKGQNYDRFIDIFPSKNEVENSYETKKLINKLIIELFKKMESPTAFINNNTNNSNSNSFKDKLRDIHLLLYISEYLDIDTMNDIIRCILTNNTTNTNKSDTTSSNSSSGSSSNNKLSARSIMTLQMIRPTLTLSGADEEEKEEEL